MNVRKMTVAFFVLLSGCSVQKMAVRTTASLMNEASPAFEEERDVVLAEEAIPANLKMMEGLLKLDPENPDLLLLLSKGYGGYAFSFLEDKMEASYRNKKISDTYKLRAQDLYRRARDYGLTYLKSYDVFAQNLDAHFLDFEKSLSVFSKQDVPHLFWAGYNWGNLVNLSKDDPEIVADVSKAEALMRRVAELDETYFNGGAHLFLGVFYGSRPQLLGGDFKKSKFHFEKALEISKEKFLLTHYMYARFYAVQTQDEALFNKLLKHIVTAEENSFPEQELANRISKIRAERLLKQKGDYF